jgi:predicted ATPase
MPSGARRLVKVAAVVGGSIDLTLLAQVANNADLDVEDGVRKLTASGVLVHGDPGDTTRVEFADELMRKVAYSTLTDAARRPLHQAVATAREKQLFGVAMESNSRGFDPSTPCAVGPEDACELAYHWNRAGRVSRGDDYLAMAESYAGGESYGVETDESDLSEVTVTLSLAADKEELETTATRAGCFAGLFR